MLAEEAPNVLLTRGKKDLVATYLNNEADVPGGNLICYHHQ